jgi:p-cumate 2,3-dioxygenase beta subunit
MPLSSVPDIRDVEAFLFDAAALLDDWKLDEWIALFTDDCRYVVPTTDLPDGEPERDLVYIDDGILQLKGRVHRLKSRHAYREYPASRTRHFISNVRIVGTDGDDVRVQANFIVHRHRGGSTEPFIGKYLFHLATVDGTFRIRHQRVVLDNETLRGHGAVSIIL